MMINRISKNTVALFLFCWASFMGSGYIQAQESSNDKVYISGHVVNEKETIGKSEVRFYGPFLTISPLREKTRGYNDSLDTKNHFSFEFNNKDLFHSTTGQLCKASMLLVTEKKEFKMGLSDYPLEPGDSIHITIRTSSKKREKEEVFFTGRGAAKYQCRREIENVLEIGQKFFQINKPLSKATIEDFRKRYQFQQKRENKALNILQKYKNKISERAYTLLKADIVAKVQKRKFIILLEHYERSLNIPKKELLEFVGYIGGFEVQALYDKDDPYMVLCPYYPSYLLTHTAMELYIEKGGDIPLFQEVAEAVMDNYSGKTLEYMLVLMAKSYFDPAPFYSSNNYQSVDNEVYDGFIDSAMALIKTPMIRKQIESKSRIKKGMTAYNFAYTDPSGNLVKLEDLQGKTVLMDMWFTGCAGCVNLANYIKDHIKPEFGDNEDFVVVSISVDREKVKWLKSLESEVYSEKEDINLFANGEKYSEIQKYYGLAGMPFSLLIDKNGKVVSYFTAHQNPEDAKALISEAMRIPFTEGK